MAPCKPLPREVRCSDAQEGERRGWPIAYATEILGRRMARGRWHINHRFLARCFVWGIWRLGDLATWRLVKWSSGQLVSGRSEEVPGTERQRGAEAKRRSGERGARTIGRGGERETGRTDERAIRELGDWATGKAKRQLAAGSWQLAEQLVNWSTARFGLGRREEGAEPRSVQRGSLTLSGLMGSEALLPPSGLAPLDAREDLVDRTCRHLSLIIRVDPIFRLGGPVVVNRFAIRE